MGNPPTVSAAEGRRPTRWGVAILLVLLAFWLLLVSGDPAVPPQARPTAETVKLGRDALRQVREAQDSPSASGTVRLDNAALQGLAALASDASGYERVEAGIADGTFSAALSLPLPLGQWINASVSLSGDHQGFPALRFAAGHLSLPEGAGRPLAELARWVLRWRGAQLPPLEEMVRSVSVQPEAIVAELRLPKRTGLVRGIIGVQGKKVDGDKLRAGYCRLVRAQRERPADDLHEHVRRAFAGRAEDAVAENRAAFAALALFTVGRRAELLSPAASTAVKACGAPRGAVLLGGRPDLAKHWAMSAALAAVLGSDAADAAGEWKELSDSLPSGSGFSFVDLAADRSGVQEGRRATDPAAAQAARARLARITGEQLLPISLLAAQEGLSEEQFLARYRGLDAARYRTTVAWIDRELARVRDRDRTGAAK